ncbi:MAG: acetate--CoA ligase family protein, partial [Gemmatimonadetes bacterium]|nr:acetate--CoA ligase family protein [Gemmatimonadota bacterium]
VQAFSKCPRPKGRRVTVLTNAGGPAIMATDALVGYGLELAEISDATKAKLLEKLPAEASVSNPIDMIASADTDSFRSCLRVLLDGDETDLAIVAFVPPLMVNPMEVVAAITEETERSGKPVLMVLMAEEQYYDRIPVEIPGSPPIYRYPETAALAAAELVNYAQWIDRDEGRVVKVDADRETARRIVEDEGTAGEYLDPDAAFRLLQAYGFPLAPWRLAHTAEEAVAAADAVGYPAVLKVGGRRIVHKSDVGGVILNIQSALEMEGAFGKMSRAIRELGHDPAEEGFLVQPMAKSGREVILGMSSDPVIGPVLLFGMGGTYVEVFQDVALRLPPITDVEAREMVESIRGYPLLEGVRGEKGVALDVVYDSIHRLSALITDFPNLAEIDLNPFLLSSDAEDCRIVDVRIRLLD